jgi:hypothetical protein
MYIHNQAKLWFFCAWNGGGVNSRLMICRSHGKHGSTFLESTFSTFLCWRGLPGRHTRGANAIDIATESDFETGCPRLLKKSERKSVT